MRAVLSIGIFFILDTALYIYNVGPILLFILAAKIFYFICMNFALTPSEQQSTSIDNTLNIKGSLMFFFVFFSVSSFLSFQDMRCK